MVAVPRESRCWWGCLADASGFVGPDDDLDAVSRLKFDHQSGDVSFDGAVADEQFFSDFGVGLSSGPMRRANRPPSGTIWSPDQLTSLPCQARTLSG